MAPAAKEASKKDGKKGDAKSKDSVEKEPSVELTEEEQLEESRKAVEEMMGVSVYEALQHERERQAKEGKRRASVSRFMYVGKLAEGATDEDLLALIESCWMARDDRYSEIRAEASPSRVRVEMSYIGG